MYNKHDIDLGIKSLEERRKIAKPEDFDRIDASMKVWQGRLAEWKANHVPEPVVEKTSHTKKSKKVR